MSKRLLSNEKGLMGLVDGHMEQPGGKARALTPEQQQQLFERLQTLPNDGGLWSEPKVGELIQQFTQPRSYNINQTYLLDFGQ